MARNDNYSAQDKAFYEKLLKMRDEIAGLSASVTRVKHTQQGSTRFKACKGTIEDMNKKFKDFVDSYNKAVLDMSRQP
jgi:hypothetical protein